MVTRLAPMIDRVGYTILLPAVSYFIR